MKADYTDKEVKFMNTLLENIVSINGVTEKVIDANIDETSIVQVGSNIEEKLFLLNHLLDDIIKNHPLNNTDTSVLSENVVGLIGSFKRILGDIEPVYMIKIPIIPGIGIPCSTLPEAKKVADALAFDTNILYKDQIVF